MGLQHPPGFRETTDVVKPNGTYDTCVKEQAPLIYYTLLNILLNIVNISQYCMINLALNGNRCSITMTYSRIICKELCANIKGSSRFVVVDLSSCLSNVTVLANATYIFGA